MVARRQNPQRHTAAPVGSRIVGLTCRQPPPVSR